MVSGVRVNRRPVPRFWESNIRLWPSNELAIISRPPCSRLCSVAFPGLAESVSGVVPRPTPVCVGTDEDSSCLAGGCQDPAPVRLFGVEF